MYHGKSILAGRGPASVTPTLEGEADSRYMRALVRRTRENWTTTRGITPRNSHEIDEDCIGAAYAAVCSYRGSTRLVRVRMRNQAGVMRTVYVQLDDYMTRQAIAEAGEDGSLWSIVATCITSRDGGGYKPVTCDARHYVARRAVREVLRAHYGRSRRDRLVEALHGPSPVTAEGLEAIAGPPEEDPLDRLLWQEFSRKLSAMVALLPDKQRSALAAAVRGDRRLTQPELDSLRIMRLRYADVLDDLPEGTPISSEHLQAQRERRREADRRRKANSRARVRAARAARAAH